MDDKAARLSYLSDMVEFETILNWRRIDPWITTSGQPSANDFDALAKDGVRAIINLASYHNKDALPDEAEVVANSGMGYIHIPVEFDNPTQDDFDAFCEGLAKFSGQRLHVHCIFNARVSAFFYRHALEFAPSKSTELKQMIDGIWKPGGVWATFVNEPNEVKMPNRFKGYDY